MATAVGVPEVASSTPILDRITPAPSPTEHSWLIALLGYIAGFAFFTIVFIPLVLLVDAIAFPSQRLISAYLDRTVADQTTLSLLLVFLFWQYPCIAIHECGHLAAGLCVKMRLNCVRIGPLEIAPPFRLSVMWKTRRFGGLVSMVPSGTRSLLVRDLVLTCGGPAASLALAAVVLSFQIQMQAYSSSACMLVLTTTFQGLLSLLPTASDGVSWDGRKILMLLFKRQERETYLAMMRIVVGMLEGTPADERDKLRVDGLLSRNEHSWETFVASSYAYSVALQEKRDEDAARFLETCLAHLDLEDDREQWFLQAVCFQAVNRKRPALAKQWLDDIPVKTRIPGLRLQAEAAMLQGLNQIENALEKLDQSKLLVSKMPRNLSKQRILQSLEKWKLELEKELVAALP